MSRHTLSLALAMSALAGAVVAQTSVEPLTDRRYTYPGQIPYKVDTDDSGRGPQFGYTQCNSTTEGPNSDCQLAMINAIDDFCIWGPPIANSTIADTEAETVAWCTKPGHGARTIPPGTLTGVQFLHAPAYVLVTGLLAQQNINIQADDDGGEMDPHGADERGNPLGSLVYTNAFPSNGGNNNSYQQVIEWHNFMGSNVFCFKICDPSIADSKEYCNNIFDETGCQFVAPAAYQDGVFETCDSDNMDPVGVYTGSDGVVSTYSQPAVVVTLPSVKTPASSNCVTYTSSVIYAAAATGVTTSGSSTGSGSSSGASSTGSGSSTGAHATTTTKGSSSTSKSTSSSTSTTSSGAAFRTAQSGTGAMAVLGLGVSLIAGLGAAVVAL